MNRLTNSTSVFVLACFQSVSLCCQNIVIGPIVRINSCWSLVLVLTVHMFYSSNHSAATTVCLFFLCYDIYVASINEYNCLQMSWISMQMWMQCCGALMCCNVPNANCCMQLMLVTWLTHMRLHFHCSAAHWANGCWSRHLRLAIVFLFLIYPEEGWSQPAADPGFGLGGGQKNYGQQNQNFLSFAIFH